jgi:hypothetical protein
MKKQIIYIAIMGLAVFSALFSSCTKSDDYKKYLASGPQVYPGNADSLKAVSGRYRVQLSWLLVSDPTITKAVVFWNDKKDSLVIPVKRTDGVNTIKVIIDKLEEQTYTFEVFTYDKEGHQSVGSTVTGRVLGSNYEATLNNWAVAQSLVVKSQPPYNAAAVVWNTFYLNGLIGTKVQYKDADGRVQSLFVPADPTGQTSVVTSLLDKFVPGDSLTYSTMYSAEAGSIDTFYAVWQKVTPLVANKYEGTYHATGKRYNFDAGGNYKGEVDIDATRDLSTLSADSCSISTIANLGAYNGTVFYLKVNADNTVNFSGYLQNNPASPIANNPSVSSSYDPAAKTFNVHYMYTNTDGSYRYMDEVWVPN